MRPSRSLVGLLIGAAALTVPAAATAEMATLSTGPLPDRPLAKPIVDAPRETGGAKARIAAAASPYPGVRATTYRTAQDGTPIRVIVSPAYGDTAAATQSFVDFLGSRRHRTELRELQVVIATPGEVSQLCAPNALACYMPAIDRMIIPGEQTPSDQAPLEFVITHEYGHHLANHRRNDPFSAIDYGTKRWATVEHICERVDAGRLKTGDYLDEPGENFAEAYAILHYSSAPWQLNPLLKPDSRALGAIATDIRSPWRRPKAKNLRGQLNSRSKSRTFKVRTTLDGIATFRLTGPRRANFDLNLRDDSKVIARTRSRTSRDSLRGALCGIRDLRVQVVRRSGSGPFRLRVATSG